MARFIISLIIIGGVLGYEGIKQYVLAEGTGSEPESVEMSKLEEGILPDSSYIRVDEHIAIYAATVYEYEQGTFSGQPDASTKVNYAYYPIVSPKHELLRKVKMLGKKYGALSRIPADVPLADGADVSILVKTHKYKKIGKVPFDRLDTIASVEGLVLNKIDSLEGEERNLVQSCFPKADLDKVLILAEGRKPASLAQSLWHDLRGWTPHRARRGLLRDASGSAEIDQTGTMNDVVIAHACTCGEHFEFAAEERGQLRRCPSCEASLMVPFESTVASTTSHEGTGLRPKRAGRSLPHPRPGPSGRRRTDALRQLSGFCL